LLCTPPGIGERTAQTVIVGYVGAPQLRPLRIGEVLDIAIKITTKHFGALARIVAAVVLPFWLLASLVLMTTVPSGALFATRQNPVDFVDPDEVDVFVAATVIVDILALLLGFLVAAGCFKAVSDAYLARDPDWKLSLKTGLRRFLPMLGTTVLYFLGVAAGFVALILPGIWLAVAWWLYAPALVAERVGGPGALGRSFNLVRGRWWPTFGVLILFVIVGGVIQFILDEAIRGVVFSDFGSPFALIMLGAVAGILAQLLVTPFQAAVSTVLYYDLRVRKEGLDIELMARAAGSPAPAGVPNLSPPPGYGPPDLPPPPGHGPGSSPPRPGSPPRV
jgi:hypothetical protein